MDRQWRVGIDMGGTFTDVVADNAMSGERRTAKVPTRSDDRVAALLDAIRAVGLEWAAIDDLVHGTTMVTNAIVEGNLARVALVSTEGFSDTLAIARQNRSDLYRIDLPPKPPPQIPDELRFEVGGRMLHTGQELEAVDEERIDRLVERLAATGAEAVAVSLLHAYANPDHEAALGDRLRARFGFVALSHRINPEAREYERMATTALSAGVMPLAADYLSRLEALRPERSRLHFFHSAGGMAAPQTLKEEPLALALSGPAAGVAAAVEMARDLAIDRAITFDMGGTTTDICLIENGRANITGERVLAGRPLRRPMVAVDSIGAGGGSIARLDLGVLRVGPESAGAQPGPACYGRGGKVATVSDADLVLGYLNPERTLGGELRLDRAAARAAIQPIAQAMGCAIEEAALGIVRVANETMMQALRRNTVENGLDGRGATLIAFGGAGPMHGAAVARAFGIARMLVPAQSSVFSAIGCANGRMSYGQRSTILMSTMDRDRRRLDDLRTGMRQTLSRPLHAAGYGDEDIQIEEFASLRYRGQSYAIEIEEPDFADFELLTRRFSDRHLEIYGYATDEPCELEAVRMRAHVPDSRRLPKAVHAVKGEPIVDHVRNCLFEGSGPLRTPCFLRASLPADRQLEGPAIVEDDHATILVPPGATARMDRFGHLHIDTGLPA